MELPALSLVRLVEGSAEHSYCSVAAPSADQNLNSASPILNSSPPAAFTASLELMSDF